MTDTHSVTPGIYPMLYAFFDEAGGLRLDAFRLQTEAALLHGAAGVAVLGLGTEVGKLNPNEREATVDTVSETLDGKADLMVTVFGATPEEQIAFGRRAIARGASWLVLQPPPERMDEPALERFFGTVIEELDCPVGVQNAPEFLGYGLSDAALLRMFARHDNFRVGKLECPAVDLAEMVRSTEGRFAVFNGRCGLELPDNLRGGAAGMVPGIETVDLQCAVWAAHRAGDENAADQAYARLAPIVGFIMQGIPHFVTYGKAIAAARMGIAPSAVREPSKPITPFGQQIVDRFVARLGRLL